MRELSSLMARLQAGGDNATRNGAEQSMLLRAIDSMVLDAYGLEDRLQRRLLGYFAGFRRPGGHAFYGLDVAFGDGSGQIGGSVEDTYVVTGQVTNLSEDGLRIEVWLTGFNADEPFWAAIPDGFPGWCLRKDVAFEGYLSRVSAREQRPMLDLLTRLRPIEFSYASNDELISWLSSPDSQGLGI
jgi:hypothetical protein